MTAIAVKKVFWAAQLVQTNAKLQVVQNREQHLGKLIEDAEGSRQSSDEMKGFASYRRRGAE